MELVYLFSSLGLALSGYFFYSYRKMGRQVRENNENTREIILETSKATSSLNSYLSLSDKLRMTNRDIEHQESVNNKKIEDEKFIIVKKAIESAKKDISKLLSVHTKLETEARPIIVKKQELEEEIKRLAEAELKKKKKKKEQDRRRRDDDDSSSRSSYFGYDSSSSSSSYDSSSSDSSSYGGGGGDSSGGGSSGDW
jgi:uncharacterized membrane protein YgcG